MATKVQLTGGAFQDSEGNVLANGYLKMVLSQDSKVNTSQICSGVEIKIDLDASGNVVASPTQSVWGNDQLTPANSFYQVTGFKSNGQPAWGPNNQQVIGNGGTFDVGTWTPNSVVSWTPPVQVPVLEVNGVANTVQSILDFEDTTTVTWVDNGDGSVSATAQGGLSIVTAGQGGFWGPGIVDTPVKLGGQSGTYPSIIANADEVRVFQFVLLNEYTIRKVSASASNNLIGRKASFGVYSLAGSKLLDGGLFNYLTSPSVQTNTITPVTLPAGVYYFAQTGSDNSGATFNGFQDNGDTHFFQAIANANATRMGIAANTSSSGVLPSTLGSITPAIPGASNVGIAMPFFEP